MAAPNSGAFVGQAVVIQYHLEDIFSLGKGIVVCEMVIGGVFPLRAVDLRGFVFHMSLPPSRISCICWGVKDLPFS